MYKLVYLSMMLLRLLQEEKFELNCPTDFVFISEKVTIKEGFGRPIGYSGAPFVE
jgi:hypothetical protein